jgi:glutamine---fructose-6-phosphate transaminase (isomerizing)
MCGIFGYVGADSDASGIVLRGLKKLEYRGYDSWGIAVAHDGAVELEKSVGKIGQASTNLPPSHSGLGHTRWATHGGVTEPNAHPHLDGTHRLALIHNGIVLNHRELREPFIRAGQTFQSETDSEVVVYMVAEELRNVDDGPDALVDAVMRAFRKLDGLNAIAVLDVASGCIAAAKSGSPLVLGWSDQGNLLASDYSALLEHTRKVTFVEDHQAALITPDSIRLFDVATSEEMQPEVTEVEWEAEATELVGYPDFMTKEIHEQPSVLRKLSREWGGHTKRLAELIRRSRGTYFVGCGTASHAAIAAQYLFARIAGRHVNYANGSEFSYMEDFIEEGSLVVALSQSGETIDVIDSIKSAKRRGADIGSLVNVEGSTLWRLSDQAVPLGAGPERCVLATKTFTAKLAILLMTAYELSDRPQLGAAQIQRAADEIELLLEDERRDLIRQIADEIYLKEHLFVIGRGPSYPLALEAALKVKEVSYVHAEGFAGGELKHGVIALIEEGTPCLVIAPRDETYDDIISGAMEVKARGAMTIGVSPQPNEAFDYHIPVADVGPATAIVNAVPAQLLGYYLALLRGHDPDKPRNLAKSVTVK